GTQNSIAAHGNLQRKAQAGDVSLRKTFIGEFSPDQFRTVQNIVQSQARRLIFFGKTVVIPIVLNLNRQPVFLPIENDVNTPRRSVAQGIVDDLLDDPEDVKLLLLAEQKRLPALGELHFSHARGVNALDHLQNGPAQSKIFQERRGRDP